MCFGELFLQCRRACLPHLQRVVDLLLISCDCVMHLSDQNYAEVLQETVIETFMCLFHGLNEGAQPCAPLGKYLRHVFEFVSLTTEKTRRPKLDYVKSCMFLLADIAGFYRVEAKSFASMPFLADRMSTLEKYNKKGDLSQVINYVRSKF